MTGEQNCKSNSDTVTFVIGAVVVWGAMQAVTATIEAVAVDESSIGERPLPPTAAPGPHRHVLVSFLQG